MRPTFCLALLAILSISLSFCAGSAYRQAVQRDTIDAYQEFLDKHPDSKYSSQAKNRLEELMYEKAKSENTIAAYGNFLDQFPDSEHAEEFKELVHKLEYEEIIKSDDPQVYMDYMSQHEDSPYYDDAASRLKAIQANKQARLEASIIEQAKQNNDHQALKDFMQRFPNSPRIDEVKLLYQNIKAENEFILSQIQKIAQGDYSEFPQPERKGDYNKEGLSLIKVGNSTRNRLTLYFSGEKITQVPLAPAQMKKIILPSGKYKVAISFDTNEIAPAYGEHEYNDGQYGLIIAF